jgi:hypothetical protein
VSLETVWQHCQADQKLLSLGRVSRAFLCDVIEPAFNNIDAQILEWQDYTDRGGVFNIEPAKNLLAATTLAFALALQATFERPLRIFLRERAVELGFALLARDALDAKWGEPLDAVFLKLCGVALSEFEAYPDLNLLQLVGNASRHGDGYSTKKLWRLRPELWPVDAPSPWKTDKGWELLEPGVPSFSAAVVSRDLIRIFAKAIEVFSDELTYRYNGTVDGLGPLFEDIQEQYLQERGARERLRSQQLTNLGYTTP